MGLSIWQLLIVLVIVILLFGTKRLKNLGSDLGNALKGFKKAVNDDGTTQKDADFSPEQINEKADESVTISSTQEVKKD